MLHTRDHTSDEYKQSRSDFRSVVKSLLSSAWEMFKALIINARDVLGSGRINL